MEKTDPNVEKNKQESDKKTNRLNNRVRLEGSFVGGRRPTEDTSKALSFFF